MTLMEAKSIENTLIKISVRSLWFMAAGLVIGVFYASMLYNEIMSGQIAILNELKAQNKEFQYQIKDVRRDISGLQEQVAELKIKSIR